MATTYLTRSADTAGSTTKGTFSAWVKKSQNTVEYPRLYTSYISSTNFFEIFFKDDDRLSVYVYFNSTTRADVVTTREFKDNSGWYHICIACDSDQGTPADRIKFYINGVLETDFDNTTYPGSGDNMKFNGAANTDIIGRNQVGTNNYFKGCMSYIAWIDGTQELPTIFGETDATSGEWKIKTTITPSSAWGANGFFILKDGSSLTDQSGEGNNFTLGGGTLTNTEDCPTDVFATLNPLNVPTSNAPTFSNGNTKGATNTTSGSYEWGGSTTLGMTKGKFYCEAKATVGVTYSRSAVGVTGNAAELARANDGPYSDTGNSSAYYSETGQVNYNNSSQYTAATYTTGDIIQVAIDLDNNRLFYGKNGTWLNSGDPTSSTGAITIGASSTCPDGAYFFAMGDSTGTTAVCEFEFNFGNGYFGTTIISSEGTNASNIGKFEYDVPTGYTALSTKGLNS